MAVSLYLIVGCRNGTSCQQQAISARPWRHGSANCMLEAHTSLLSGTVGALRQCEGGQPGWDLMAD
jgi:hypothetical protein